MLALPGVPLPLVEVTQQEGTNRVSKPYKNEGGFILLAPPLV